MRIEEGKMFQIVRKEVTADQLYTSRWAHEGIHDIVVATVGGHPVAIHTTSIPSSRRVLSDPTKFGLAPFAGGLLAALSQGEIRNILLLMAATNSFWLKARGAYEKFMRKAGPNAHTHFLEGMKGALEVLTAGPQDLYAVLAKYMENATMRAFFGIFDEAEVYMSHVTTALNLVYPVFQIMQKPTDQWTEEDKQIVQTYNAAIDWTNDEGVNAFKKAFTEGRYEDTLWAPMREAHASIVQETLKEHGIEIEETGDFTIFMDEQVFLKDLLAAGVKTISQAQFNSLVAFSASADIWGMFVAMETMPALLASLATVYAISPDLQERIRKIVEAGDKSAITKAVRALQVEILGIVPAVSFVSRGVEPGVDLLQEFGVSETVTTLTVNFPEIGNQFLGIEPGLDQDYVGLFERILAGEFGGPDVQQDFISMMFGSQLEADGRPPKGCLGEGWASRGFAAMVEFLARYEVPRISLKDCQHFESVMSCARPKEGYLMQFTKLG